MARRAPTTLPIYLDRERGPLHEQIFDDIRRAIVTGALRPNTRITSSRALAADLVVSRNTAQLALDKLQAEGYLVTRRGSGTFVADVLPDATVDAPAPAPPPDRARPLLSRRGAALASGRRIVRRRIPGPARAFRLGVPALEAFPIATWARLASRRLAAITASDLDYGGGAGLRRLREAIAEHVRTARGVRCDARQVYIVNSAQRGLELACRLLLEAGDAAAVEDPGYPGAWSALASAGARVVPVPVDQAGLDVGALAARRGVRLVYVTPSHQFPLGVRMSLARRRALIAWAAANAGWIVEDDYDSEFRFDTHPLPCLQGLDVEGRVIYIGTFSKSVFPALRIGFVIAPPDLRDQLVAVRLAQGDAEPPFLDQAILADFLAEGHFARHVRRMHTLYAERLGALEDSARRWCGGGLVLRSTRTGLHAVGELAGIDADRVCDEAALRGVEIAAISDYTLRSATHTRAIALGFGGVAPASLDRGMQELASAIEAAGRTRAA